MARRPVSSAARTAAILAALSLLGACSSGHGPRALQKIAQRAVMVAPSTAPPTTHAPAPVCPLTGMPAPTGHVPARGALAIKIDNLNLARPQTGLSTADIVYEEPVEGGITRFIAVFQCRDAARVEPVRSGRLVDPQILSQYGPHPLLGYAGAIAPAVAAIDGSSLIDVGVNRAPLSAYSRDPARPAPHNLITSTAALYAFAAALHAPAVPPSPVFTFGPLTPGASPAASVHIAYQYSDVTWTWEQQAGVWFRSYSDTGPATLGEGGQITANNIIVMRVAMYPSQYVEDPRGSHENLLTLTGTGPLQVFRDGAVVNGTWSRPDLAGATSYLDATGKPIDMEPGQTWIELVPTTVSVTTGPPVR